MFEDMTYEVLNQRMLERMETSFPDVDMREGSLAFQAIAAAAMELSLIYEALDTVLNESFVGTASREYLLKACEQIGMDIEEFEPTYAQVMAEFDAEVPIGSRWNLDLYNYTVYEQLEKYGDLFRYSLYCDTAGTGPNSVFGDLTPVEYLNGTWSYARIERVLIPGEDEATDDEIRDAYATHISGLGTNGNIAQYEEWCSEIDGVGRVNVRPLWAGANTVQLLILDAEGDPASQALVNSVQEIIDPGTYGLGQGLAPIGAKVTVKAPTVKNINIAATVRVESEYAQSIMSKLSDAAREYFRSISFEQDYVSYMKLGAVLLDVEGVKSITSYTINGGTDDIEIGETYAPVLGTVNWGVISA